ncbi:MAG: N-6 DNA methylase [Smithella sp.]
MKLPRQLRDGHQKAIAKLFEKLTYRHSRWTVWSDFVLMAACTLSLLDVEHREERIQMHNNAAAKYNAAEMDDFRDMFEEIVQTLEDNPNQDFLGELFMALELSNEAVGQFFTPYSVCAMIAKMQCVDIVEKVKEKGYISVNDPAVGAGALLIAFANECRAQGVNYQNHILFVAQDIDYVAAMMCYIQLSLLGCAGYVIVGNTLTTPPTEPLSNQNVWYTPMYYCDLWQWRRIFKALSVLQRPRAEEAEAAEVAPLPAKADEQVQLTLF